MLGIRVEEQELKIALVAKKKGGLYLAQALSVPLQDLAIAPLECALKGERPRIASGLELQEVIFRTLSLPLKARGKVLSALPFQLEALLPFPFEQSVACPFLKPLGPHATEVSIIATSKDFLKAHLNRITSADLRPDVVSCAPIALYRLARLLFPEQKNLLVFHFDIDKTNCVYIQDGHILNSQSIRIGKNDLIQAFKQAFPDKEKQELQTLSSSSWEEKPALASFAQRLDSELGRLAVFIKEKTKCAEEMPWALLGEHTSCMPLANIFARHFTERQLPLLPPDGFSPEPLHTHTLPIGFALDALAADAHSVQLLQNEFTAFHHRKARKQRALIYTGACAVLSIFLALSTGFLLQRKTRELSDKLHAYFPSSQKQPPSLSQAEIEEELQKCEHSLLKQKNSFPFFLTVPKVSEVLAWLSTHSGLATVDGLPKEGIDIRKMRYHLTKFPTLDDPSAPYQALIELEFTATTPRSAREFHEALLKGDRIVNAKKEVKWNAQGHLYSVQFELAMGPAL